MGIAFIIFIVIAMIVVSVIKLSAASKQRSTDDGHVEEQRMTAQQPEVFETKEKVSAATSRQFDKILENRRKSYAEGETSLGHHESHCDIKGHSSGDKYRVEKVPVMNSIGGRSTEGCQEHYDLRYVKEDEEEPEKKTELNELQKAIVYGEILNDPAFRRNGYR